MQVTYTKAFVKNLKRLSPDNIENVIAALKLFVENPEAKSLNFESVRSRRGYHTIRANYSVRVLLRQVDRSTFDVVAVGNHDFIYAAYFRS